MATKMCPSCYGQGYQYEPSQSRSGLLYRVLHRRCGGTGRVQV